MVFQGQCPASSLCPLCSPPILTAHNTLIIIIEHPHLPKHAFLCRAPIPTTFTRTNHYLPPLPPLLLPLPPRFPRGTAENPSSSATLPLPLLLPLLEVVSPNALVEVLLPAAAFALAYKKRKGQLPREKRDVPNETQEVKGRWQSCENRKGNRNRTMTSKDVRTRKTKDEPKRRDQNARSKA